MSIYTEKEYQQDDHVEVEKDEARAGEEVKGMPSVLGISTLSAVVILGLVLIGFAIF